MSEPNLTKRGNEPLLVALLAYAVERCGSPPLSRVPGVWSRAIDGRWWVAINGHGTPEKVEVTAPGFGADPANPFFDEVPPYSALIYFNGWPVVGQLDDA